MTSPVVWSVDQNCKERFFGHPQLSSVLPMTSYALDSYTSFRYVQGRQRCRCCNGAGDTPRSAGEAIPGDGSRNSDKSAHPFLPASAQRPICLLKTQREMMLSVKVGGNNVWLLSRYHVEDCLTPSEETDFVPVHSNQHVLQEWAVVLWSA
jgi:hypothetical protein